MASKLYSREIANETWLEQMLLVFRRMTCVEQTALEGPDDPTEPAFPNEAAARAAFTNDYRREQLGPREYYHPLTGQITSLDRPARRRPASPEKAPPGVTTVANPEKPRQPQARRFVPGQISRAERKPERAENKRRGLARLRYVVSIVFVPVKNYGYTPRGRLRRRPIKSWGPHFYQPDFQILVFHKKKQVGEFNFAPVSRSQLGLYCSEGTTVLEPFQRRGIASRTYRWFERTFHVYLQRGSTNARSSALWDYLEGKRDRRLTRKPRATYIVEAETVAF